MNWYPLGGFQQEVSHGRYRRITDGDTLDIELAAWEAQRNQGHSIVRWQFTMEDARVKLRRLYPTV